VESTGGARKQGKKNSGQGSGQNLLLKAEIKERQPQESRGKEKEGSGRVLINRRVNEDTGHRLSREGGVLPERGGERRDRLRASGGEGRN